MLSTTGKTRICALLLGLIFLAAQFHFCADLNGGPKRTHFCPFCASAAAAIAADSPILGMAPAVPRLEIARPQLLSATEVALLLSSRAPPISWDAELLPAGSIRSY